MDEQEKDLGPPAAGTAQKQDFVLAMVRARRAIGRAQRLAQTEGALQAVIAVERVCDALDGVVAALGAEPALRIDYLHVQAPAPVLDASKASLPKAAPEASKK